MSNHFQRGGFLAVRLAVCLLPMIWSAVHGSIPNSDLLQTTTSRNNGTAVLTATRAWDFGYRLRSIQNVVGYQGGPGGPGVAQTKCFERIGYGGFSLEM